MSQRKARTRTEEARMVKEILVNDGGRRSKGRRAVKAHASYLLNPISHRILVEKAKSAPKMVEGRISDSSRIIIEGTAVVLEKALRRLADK